jgi:hypothetical protein
MGQTVGNAIGEVAGTVSGALAAPFDLVAKPFDWVGLDPIGDAVRLPGKAAKAAGGAIGGLVGDAVGDDPKAPQNTAASAAPGYGPSPTFTGATETSAMRRRKLAALRQGVMSTIKTSSQGVTDSALTQAAPTMTAGASGAKTKLGV